MAELMNNVELVMWNLGEGDPPTVTSVRNSLEQSGLSRSHAADIPLSTAFRRACDELRSDNTQILIRKIDDDLHCQVNNLLSDGKRLRAEIVGLYRCHSTRQIRAVDYDSDTELASKLQLLMEERLVRYQWGDLSKVVQDVVTKCGLGAYSPRRSGGVYFIPINPSCPMLLDQIESFSNRVGIRFLRYSVPDSAAQRQEIMDAIAAGMEQEIDTHRQAITEYNNPTTSILDKRLAAIETTKVLVNRLTEHLGSRCQALLATLDDLAGQVTRLKSSGVGVPIMGRRITLG